MNTITFFCNFICAWSRRSLGILPVMDSKLLQSLYVTWKKVILCIKRTQSTNYHFATGILLNCLDKMLTQTMNFEKFKSYLPLSPYSNYEKKVLSTKIVIFSYPKLLSFSVLTFIKWRLTPSYAAKDTIFWQKRPKTIVIRIIVLDDNIQIYSYGLLCETVLSMRTV